MAIVQASSPTLAEARPGRHICEQVYAMGQNAIRLKRLGVCQGRELELVGQGDPMVLRIGESRVGVSRQLAQLVTLESLH